MIPFRASAHAAMGLGPVQAGRLGEAVGLTSGALTIAIDRLERAGYVARRHDPDDRRRVIVALAPADGGILALFAHLPLGTPGPAASASMPRPAS